MGHLQTPPLNPLAYLLENRRVFEGQSIDADGTSLMDDAFNIISHENGHTIQFFIADTSVYYEHMGTLPKARGENSPKPNFGDESELFTPMSFSLDVNQQTPAIGVFAEIDKDGNFLSVDVERVMFVNKHAYSTSEMAKALKDNDPQAVAWRDVALKIKQAANRETMANSTHGFSMCETFSSFANYALTVFCNAHDIPLLYQNRSGHFSLSDTLTVQFYDRKDAIDALGVTTTDGLNKYNHSFAPTLGLFEYSPVAKGNVSKSYIPYARFSSPLRLFHDTVNIWNVTEFLETGQNVDFSFDDLEKIGKQQTRVYQDTQRKDNEIKTQKLEKEIVDIIQSGHADKRVKHLSSKQLFTMLSHLFHFNAQEISSFTKRIQDSSRGTPALTEIFSHASRDTSPRRRKGNGISYRHGNRYVETKTTSSDLRAKLTPKATHPKITRDIVLAPFIQEACVRLEQENSVDFLLISTLGNPKQSDQERRLAKLAKRKLLDGGFAADDEILNVAIKKKLGVDEIYFTLHEHENRNIAFQPFLRKGSQTFSVPVVPSTPRRQKSLQPHMAIAQRSLIEALLNDALVLPYKSRFDWVSNSSKVQSRHFARNERKQRVLRR